MSLPDTFWIGAIGSLVFGMIGIVLLVLGFVFFDFVLRKVDFQEELNKGNMSIAVVVSTFLLAAAYIAAHVVK